MRKKINTIILFVALFFAIGIAQTGFNARYSNVQNGVVDAQLTEGIGNLVTFIQWGTWGDVGERNLRAEGYRFNSANNHDTYFYILDEELKVVGLWENVNGNFFLDTERTHGIYREM